MINLKGNIDVKEINTLISSFKNDFHFDKEDVIIVNNILNSMIYEIKNPDHKEAINSINQYCTYEDKLIVCKMLFKVALSDNEIDHDELLYISNCSQEANWI